MTNKAIFGGTFDPVHNGHLHIAYEALKLLKLDKLIFMPSGNPPHKTQNKKTDAVLRYELLKMAIRGEERFQVSKYEIEKAELSYTYKTMEYFKALEPEASWYFISGMDCLMDLYYWKNIDRIFNACTLAVFNRPGFDRVDILKQKQQIEEDFNTEIYFMDIPLMDISSSNIRKKIIFGENANYLMPQSVYNTVKELRLYDERGE